MKLETITVLGAVFHFEQGSVQWVKMQHGSKKYRLWVGIPGRGNIGSTIDTDDDPDLLSSFKHFRTVYEKLPA